MSYLTFEEYQALGGKCTQDAFLTLQFDTESKMDYITSGRLAKLIEELGTVPKEVQMLEVKLVNIEDNSEIESQSFSLLNETYGKFLVREKIGTYIIKFELNSILYQASSSLLIYKNQLSLISSQLVLPTGDTVISTIKV